MRDMIARRGFISGAAATGLMAGCVSSDSGTTYTETTPGSIISYDPSFLQASRGDLGRMGFASRVPYEPHSYQVMVDPTGTAPTTLVERFELHEEDCYMPEDCAMDKQRSEIQGEGARYGEECWYHMYLYIPNGFHSFGTYCHVGLNMHSNNNNGTNNTALIMPIMGGANDVTRYYAMVYDGNRRQRLTLKPYLEMVGRWTKLEVHSMWSETGFHRFYFNNELVYDYSGYTLGADAQSPFKLKYGLYRGRVNEYKQRFNMRRYPDQIVYYADVRKTSIRV